MEKVDGTSEIKLFQKFVYYSLFILGVPVKIKQNVKWTYYSFTTLIFCFTILGNIVTIINHPAGLYVLQVMSQLFLSLTIVFALLGIIPINRHFILKILLKLDPNSTTYIGEEEMQITAEKYTNIFRDDLRTYIFVCAFAEVAGILGKTILKQDLYNFMYLYSCGPMPEQPPVRFCLSEGSLEHFVLNDIMAFVFVACEGAIVQVGHLLMLTLVVSIDGMMKRYDELLLASIEKVKKMSKPDTEDYTELKSLVRYQQKVKRYIRLIKWDLGTKIFVAMHVIYIYVTMLFMVVPIRNKKIHPMYLKAPFCVIVSYIVSVHYSFCKHWQAINYVEEHFCDTLLEFPWYERDIKFQKCYLMCLMLNQKCDPITFLGLCEVNLRFFSANMNRLYSVVNLLLLKYK